MKKIYGSKVAVFVKDGKTLEIYELKKGLKGVLWEDKYSNSEPTSIAHFYYKDNDATIYRVKEYFGFNSSKLIYP